MNRCKKLRDVPPVATDWQQTTWCPDCEHYDRGACAHPARTGKGAPCPFDRDPLPLREVPGARDDVSPRQAVLRRAITSRIADRTGGRIRLLEVEVGDAGVVVRGLAPCFYLMQLALQGALDVLGADGVGRVKLDLQVPERPPLSGADSQ
jgi:hypothetical protein